MRARFFFLVKLYQRRCSMFSQLLIFFIWEINVVDDFFLLLRFSSVLSLYSKREIMHISKRHRFAHIFFPFCRARPITVNCLEECVERGYQMCLWFEFVSLSLFPARTRFQYTRAISVANALGSCACGVLYCAVSHCTDPVHTPHKLANWIHKSSMNHARNEIG